MLPSLPSLHEDRALEMHETISDPAQEALAELARCRALLAETQALAGIGHWEWDVATDRLEWSDEHYRIYGLPAGSFRTREDLLGVMPPARRAAFLAYIDRALVDHQPYEMEVTSVRPDGEPRIVHGRGRVILGEDGRPVRLLGTTQDVTDRRRAEQAARERDEAAKRQQDQFLGTVTHELRTPLTSLLGYAEFLEEELAGPLTDRQRTYLAAIQGNATRINRLVDDLLDCAASEQGTFQVHRTPTDLVPIVAECLAAMAPQALQAEVRLVQDLDAAELPLEADAGRLGQVLGNLVGNALKFTPAGGTIAVKARRQGAEVRCEVRDSGLGIAPEHQAHLFERFRQVTPSSPRMGLGLGLAICRTIVEAHGGRIGVESERGAGAAFWFTLPG